MLVVLDYVEVILDGYGDIGIIVWVEKMVNDLFGIVVIYDCDVFYLKKGVVLEIKILVFDIQYSVLCFDVKGMIIVMIFEVKCIDDGQL